MHIEIQFEHIGTQTFPLQNYVESRLDGSHDSEDPVSQVKSSTELTAQAFARLVELLAKKQILSAEEVVWMANGYPEKARFVVGGKS